MKEYRGKWLSFYPKKHKLVLILEWGSYFSPYPQIHFSPGWGQIFLNLPYNTGRDECENPEFGFYLYNSDESAFFDQFWLCWNMKKYCFHMPWSLDWVRTSILKKDNSWEHDTKKDRKKFWDDKWKDVIWTETYPYVATSRAGTKDSVLATVKVEEREWRQRWLKWTKWNNLIRKSISIDFNQEIGDMKGSWKGGTIGCSYNMLPNETPLDCLKRMEKERMFR